MGKFGSGAATLLAVTITVLQIGSVVSPSGAVPRRRQATPSGRALASPQALPGASPGAATLPVVVANLTCRTALDPGIPAAVEGGTATVPYLKAIGCTPASGATFLGGGATCTTDAAGRCTLHVPRTVAVTVSEVKPPYRLRSLVSSLAVPLDPKTGGEAVFVNVPIAPTP